MRDFSSEIVALVAYGEVTGGVAPVFLLNRGFSAIAYVGVGIYDLTLETNESLTDSNMQVFLTVTGDTPLIVAANHQSNSVIRVTALTNAGAAAEVSFTIQVKRPTNNQSASP